MTSFRLKSFFNSSVADRRASAGLTVQVIIRASLCSAYTSALTTTPHLSISVMQRRNCRRGLNEFISYPKGPNGTFPLCLLQVCSHGRNHVSKTAKLLLARSDKLNSSLSHNWTNETHLRPQPVIAHRQLNPYSNDLSSIPSTSRAKSKKSHDVPVGSKVMRNVRNRHMSLQNSMLDLHELLDCFKKARKRWIFATRNRDLTQLRLVLHLAV